MNTALLILAILILSAHCVSEKRHWREINQGTAYAIYDVHHFLVWIGGIYQIIQVNQ